MYEEAVRIFYSKLYCHDVPQGEEPILRSHVLVPGELSASSLCDTLNLPNEGDHVFLSSSDKFALLSKPESELFNNILTSYTVDRKVKMTQLKFQFRMVSKLFIENIVPRADNKDFMHPLQSIFFYVLVTELRLDNF